MRATAYSRSNRSNSAAATRHSSKRFIRMTGTICTGLSRCRLKTGNLTRSSIAWASGRTDQYVHEHCETTYGDDGKPLRSIGTVQDITSARKWKTPCAKAAS